MDAWLPAALAAIAPWIDYQLRASRQPGCVLAITHRGACVLDQAFGQADLAAGEPLTPRHRFRVASHSKSFAATAILLLREAGRLRLDDPLGRHLPGLHREAAEATIAQCLSHTAGLVRDGADSGFFTDRRPFPDAAGLLADLAEAPPIPANTRFKYSNHGYGLLGLVVEALTGEPYAAWLQREVIARFGLAETTPDMPLRPGTPFAHGHSGRMLLGERRVIPAAFATGALAPAAGLVSTAADLARFYALLAPEAEGSPLSPASRREMSRRQWRIPHAFLESWYGIGLACGTLAGWEWFGHGGGMQGSITRTAAVPAQQLSVSLLTNAIDGLAGPWLDGVLHILQLYARRGAPEPALADWTGRWWTVWGAIDLLPAGNRVFLANPAFWNPLMDAGEIEVTGQDEGRIALANGYGSHGEAARLIRGADGRVAELRLGATRLLPEAAAAAEIDALYPAAAASL